LRRASNAGRRRWMIQNSQLAEHCSLIPIEMLVGYFARFKPNNARYGELSSSTRGWYAWQYPIHFDGVGKTNHHLFDEAIVAERLR